VVTIHPRWSPTHPFPIPLHDTLAAYDWITQNLLTPLPVSTTRSSSAPPAVPILVYGTGLGGTLATSLALTESRPAQNPTVSAFAVHETVFDWTGIVASAPPPSFPASTLHGLRSQLFASPANAFDAFASPILFFRTSGLATPLSLPTSSNHRSPPAAATATDAATKDPDPQFDDQYVPRKSYLLFPPARSGLRIPDTRIAVSSSAERRRKGDDDEGGFKSHYYHDPWAQLERARQAAEMVRIMRRSIILEKRKMARKPGLDGGRSNLDGDGDGENEEWQAEAERRVALVSVEEKDGDGGSVAEGEWARGFFEDAIGRCGGE
jgi:acetyl esterase/lipase